MPRGMGTVTDALITANEIEYWDFVAITLPSPTGLLRFTNRPSGYTGSIDGSSQTWNEVFLEVGPITQSRQQILQVNWIKFANVDYFWTNLMFNPGIRDCLVNIYSGWWNCVTNVFGGAIPVYTGMTDDIVCDQFAQFALRPFYIPWNYRILPERRSSKCINVYRNPEDCQFVGAEPVGETTCAKTRTACLARLNTIHINIYDDAPKLNESLTWGGVVRSLPNG